MSLLNQLRIDIADTGTSASGTVIVDSILEATTSPCIVGGLRVDIADTATSASGVAGLDPTAATYIIRDIRADIADIGNMGSGTLSTANTLLGQNTSPCLISDLRADIADSLVASGNFEGTVTLDNVVVNNNLTVNGSTTLNGAQCWNVTIVTDSYAIIDSDTVVLVNNSSGGPITITLPTSACQGRVLYVKDIAGNAFGQNITIVPSAGAIDGYSGFILSQNYQSLSFIYNGSAWNIV